MTVYKSREQDSIKQFDKWAPEYDCGLWNSYFKSGYKNIIEVAAQYISPNSSILDIGCGTGDLEFLLYEKVNNGEIIGLDLSRAMIEGAESKRLKLGVNNVKFVLSRAHSLPYSDGYFDVVFCLNSLHHFPDHLDFFKEVNRVLKKGGRFILLDLVNDTIIRKVWIQIIKLIFGEKDVEFHSKKGTSDLLTQNGFKPENQKNFMFFTLISISEKI